MIVTNHIRQNGDSDTVWLIDPNDGQEIILQYPPYSLDLAKLPDGWDWYIKSGLSYRAHGLANIGHTFVKTEDLYHFTWLDEYKFIKVWVFKGKLCPPFSDIVKSIKKSIPK